MITLDNSVLQLIAGLTSKDVARPIEVKDRSTDNTIAISKEVLLWAVGCSGRSISEIEGKDIGINLSAWIDESKKPTLKQLQTFADRTYTSVPLLLLNHPVEEELPIKDFRLLSDNTSHQPTRNLLDTIYDCKLKQDWYRVYCVNEGLDKLDIVRRFTPNQDYRDVAQKLNDYFSFSDKTSDYSKYVSLIENKGILVMSTSTVKGNTHRKLSLEDARGFALHDEYAPVIFVNADESVNGKKFTLMHELAHIVIGASGISNNYTSQKIKDKTEIWCNKVATEILVPENSFRDSYLPDNIDPFSCMEDMAEKFKVSTLVIMLRILELGYYKGIEKDFWQKFAAEKIRLIKELNNKTSDGGNFYNNVPSRNSKRLCEVLLNYTLADKTLYRDTMKLLNIHKPQTLNKLMSRFL